jgi:hypothetical protein
MKHERGFNFEMISTGKGQDKEDRGSLLTERRFRKPNLTFHSCKHSL